MQNIVSIYPSDVLAAVEAAKKRNPKDKFGYSAVRVNFKGAHQAKNGRATYYPFEILLDDARGWQKVVVQFMNLTHVGKIAPLDERIKNDVSDIQFLFKGNYTFNRVRTNPDGTKTEVVEPYGQAKIFLCRAFVAHIQMHIKKKELKEDKIIGNVKFEKTLKDKNGKMIGTEEFDVPNINVQIPTIGGEDKKVSGKDPKTKFRCTILDVTKPCKVVDPKKDWPFEAAKAKKYKVTDEGREEYEEELNNGNVHLFLRGGSLISGFDDMGDVCVSNMGISNPSKISVCMVKQSVIERVSAAQFSQDDFAQIAGAAATSAPASTGDGSSTQAAVVDNSYDDIASMTAGTVNDDFAVDTSPAEDFEFGS